MVTESLCVTDDDRRQVWSPVVCLWGSDPGLQHQRSQTDPEDHPDLARHEGGRGRWWRYSLVSPSHHIEDELEHGRRNLSSEARSAESWEPMDLGQQQLDGGFPERIDGKASRLSPVATRSGRTLWSDWCSEAPVRFKPSLRRRWKTTGSCQPAITQLLRSSALSEVLAFQNDEPLRVSAPSRSVWDKLSQNRKMIPGKLLQSALLSENLQKKQDCSSFRSIVLTTTKHLNSGLTFCW